MEIKKISQELSSNSYPGRGIILGRSADNKKAVIAYFIMGRSENSRNRIFEKNERGGIRTKAFDESKMVDPSLIIYNPVLKCDGKTIVTNGDQTDTIYDCMKEGHCYRHALLTREFEPDAPNYTPRISGVVSLMAIMCFQFLNQIWACRSASDSFMNIPHMQASAILFTLISVTAILSLRLRVNLLPLKSAISQ